MKLKSKGMFYFEQSMNENDQNKLIEHMIASGVDIIVSERFSKNLKKKLVNYMTNEYLLLSYDEFVKIPCDYIVGTVVLFLDPGKEHKQIRAAEKTYGDGVDLNIIYVCEKDFYYEKEEHYFKDLVEYAIPISTILLEDIVC
jgi:transcriptional accessory protein Tex/SPT6